MPKNTRTVVELIEVMRGDAWNRCTKPIHYDVKRVHLYFFLSLKGAISYATGIGLKSVQAIEVNAWLTALATGGPNGYELRKVTLYRWSKRTYSGFTFAEMQKPGKDRVRSVVRK